MIGLMRPRRPGMKRLLPALALLAFGLAPAGPQARPAGAEEEKLTAFFKHFLDEEFRQRPLEATRLGDHRFDHLLDEVSAKARARWAERYRATLADLPRK